MVTDDDDLDGDDCEDGLVVDGVEYVVTDSPLVVASVIIPLVVAGDETFVVDEVASLLLLLLLMLLFFSLISSVFTNVVQSDDGRFRSDFKSLKLILN